MIKKYKFKNVYKKWSFLIFLNDLVYLTLQMSNKKIIFLKFDIQKNNFWAYTKLKNSKYKYIKQIYKSFFLN